MTKPGDDKDACVTPHTASTLPGTPPTPPLCKAALHHVPVLAAPPSHEDTAARPRAP